MTAPIHDEDWNAPDQPTAPPERHTALRRESTSALLRRTQEAWMASQRDLTRVHQQLDDARTEVTDLAGMAGEAFAKTRVLQAELASARAELEQVRKNEELRARLIREKNDELEQLRAAQMRDAAGWIVARDGGRNCDRCEQEIRRGEAYESTPGAESLLLHIHCPDREGGTHG